MTPPSASGPANGPFDTRGAARYVGCSPSHLKKLRMTGGGPVFSRLFVRKGITYERGDLDAWKSARRFASTTEYPEAAS